MSVHQLFRAILAQSECFVLDECAYPNEWSVCLVVENLNEWTLSLDIFHFTLFECNIRQSGRVSILNSNKIK